MEAYEQAMAQHPEDVVTKTGYAEVLKALNRLPEALEAYEQAMAQHPENVVTKNGASCVLAALGLWERALMLLLKIATRDAGGLDSVPHPWDDSPAVARWTEPPKYSSMGLCIILDQRAASISAPHSRSPALRKREYERAAETS